MKKILFILFFIAFAGVKSNLFAQTEKELLIRLMDKQDKMLEQMAAMDKRLSEQIANLDKKLSVIETKLDTKMEGLQKRINIIFALLVGMFGIISVMIAIIIWDRRAEFKPILGK